MNQAIPIATLLLAIFAGCLETDEARNDELLPPDNTTPNPATPNLDPSEPPQKTDPEARIWNGETLEAIDCQLAFFVAHAPHDTVQARLPPHLELVQNGPVALTLLFLDCRSMTLGNESLQKGAWTYITYVAVRGDENQTDGDVTYLLEIASNWPEVVEALEAAGVPVVAGTFQNDRIATTDGILITADGLAYELRDTGANPTYDTSLTEETTLLAGPQAEVALQFVINSPTLANLPVPAAIRADGGVLSQLFGPATTAISIDGQGGATFSHRG